MWKNSTSVELIVTANESITLKSVECSSSGGLNCSSNYMQGELRAVMEISIVLHGLNPAELHTLTLILENDVGNSFDRKVHVCMGKLSLFIAVIKWYRIIRLFITVALEPGADLGGGGLGALAFSSGIRPPTDPKGPPLNHFEIFIFG